MAGVIAISSDEDQSDECIEKPAKKRKTDSVICLDDDEEKKFKSSNKTKKNDVIVDLDEDIFCFDRDKNGANITSKQSSNSIKPAKESHSTNVTTITLESRNGDKIIKKALSELSSKNKSNKLELKEPEVDNDVEMFKDSKGMQEFINVCLSQIHNENTRSLFRTKIPICRKLFDKVGSEYFQSEHFKALLEEKITVSKKNSMIAISSFNDVYQNLRARVRDVKRNGEPSEITEPIPSKNEKIITKLEHALQKVQKMLTRLEDAEVDFDDEEDSNYIKMQRYRERAVKIYEKICKYRQEDAHADHITYTRLDFSGSQYPEVNHAINKKFKNNSVFPTYYEVERCVQKTVKDKNVNLSQARTKEEARDCFKKLGNLLQKRRKLDLLSVHSHYMTTNDDPAAEDRDLESKLIANSKDAKTKINDICEKYTKLQEAGQEPKVSSDSDDSKRESTTDEDE